MSHYNRPSFTSNYLSFTFRYNLAIFGAAGQRLAIEDNIDSVVSAISQLSGGAISTVDAPTRNAIAHAYVSAALTLDFGSDVAFIFGVQGELFGTGQSSINVFKDLWNNQIGIHVGTEVQQGGSTIDNLPEALARAYLAGELIVYENPTLPNFDPRIAAHYTERSPAGFFDARAVGNVLEKVLGDLYGTEHGPNCFLSGTPIKLADGSSKDVSEIRVGDVVAAFDAGVRGGRDVLRSGPVTRTFNNITRKVIVAHLPPEYSNGSPVAVTPGHPILCEDGLFRRVGEIVSGNMKVILDNGASSEISAEALDLLDLGSLRFPESLVRINGEAIGWRTYNFEVEKFHTYVAGGMRVHNQSVLDYAPADSVVFSITRDPDGVPVKATYLRSDGVFVEAVGGQTNAEPGTDRIEETHHITRPTPFGVAGAEVISGAASLSIKRTFVGGVETERHVTALEYGPNVIQGEEIGRIFGSSLGNYLGGNTIAGQIAATTFIGTLTQNVGEFLQKGVDIALASYDVRDTRPDQALDTDDLSTSPLEDAAKISFSDFHVDLLGNLRLEAIGSLSSMLVAELGEALELEGFGGQLVSTAAGSVTKQLLKNVSAIAIEAAGLSKTFGIGNLGPNPLMNGLDMGSLGLNIAGSLGGYFGNQLASEIVTPVSAEASLFASAGSAIGSYVGGLVFSVVPVFGSVIGSFVGSFIGNVAGTYLGNQWFDEDPKAFAKLGLDEAGDLAILDVYSDDGGNRDFAKGLAQNALDTIEAMVAEVGGVIDTVHGVTPGFYGHNAQMQARFYTTVDGTRTGALDVSGAWKMNAAGSQQAVALGIMTVLKDLQIIGGDPILKRAFENSTAEDLIGLAADLQIAGGAGQRVERGPAPDRSVSRRRRATTRRHSPPAFPSAYARRDMTRRAICGWASAESAKRLAAQGRHT